MGSRPVWRVRDRASFAALRRSGRRFRRGPLSLVWVGPDAGGSTGRPAVAFAVGRSVGGAVARNRLRRRLRAVVDGVVASECAAPAGTYLLSAQIDAVELSVDELRSLVAGLFGDVVGIAGRAGDVHAAVVRSS